MTMSCLNRQLSRKPLLAGYSQFHQRLLRSLLPQGLLDRLDHAGRLGVMDEMAKMVQTDPPARPDRQVKVG